MSTASKSSPPLFKDFGKPANNLFTVNHIPEKLRLKAGTKVTPDFEVKSEFTQSLTDDKLSKSELVLTKTFKCLKIEEKLGSDNVLSSKASVTCCKLPGAEFELNSLYDIQNNKCSPTFKVNYKNNYLYGSVALTRSYPQGSAQTDSKTCQLKECLLPHVVDSELVVGHSDLYGGVKVVLPKSASYRPTDTTFSLYYKPGEFELHGELKNFKTYTGSLFFLKSQDLKLGLQATFNPQKSGTLLTIGGDYKLDSVSTVSAKFSSIYDLGLSLKYKVNKHTDVVLASNFKVDKLSQPVHKFGVGVELSA